MKNWEEHYDKFWESFRESFDESYPETEQRKREFIDEIIFYAEEETIKKIINKKSKYKIKSILSGRKHIVKE